MDVKIDETTEVWFFNEHAAASMTFSNQKPLFTRLTCVSMYRSFMQFYRQRTNALFFIDIVVLKYR